MIQQELKPTELLKIKDKIIIGRNKDADIYLDNPLIARIQCFIVKKKELYLIENLGLSPIRVNRKSINTQCEIKLSDTLHIAENEFIIT